MRDAKGMNESDGPMHGMSSSSGVKALITIAWTLSLAAVLMFFFVSSGYPGGYETMLGHAAILFFAGLGVGGLGLVAAAVVRMKIANILSGWWVVFAGVHVAANLVLFGLLALQ